MGFSTLRSIVVVSAAIWLLPRGFAQGTAQDYEMARSFLSGNLQHSIYIADVSAHWIDKTNRFWYHKVSPSGSGFIVVDAERNTSGPAFDHTKLAAALAAFTKRQVSATDLPFDDIEFSEDGKWIHFDLDDARRTCTLSDYKCTSEPAEKPDEARSPDKKWVAYVKD